MTKLFTKIRLKQISKFFAIFCAIFLSLNTFILHLEAQAVDHDSTTFDASIDLPIFYGFRGCTSGLTIADGLAGGENVAGSNLQSTNLDRYGTDDCNVMIAYNDPDTDFEVYLYKSENLPLRHNLVDTNGATISDINNAGTDYIIDVTGNDDTTEEWGYRIDTGATPGTSLSPTGILVNKRDEKHFDAKTECSGGECFFAVLYSAGAGASYSGADNIISGANGVTPGSGTCTNVASLSPECSFTLETHANIIYTTEPGQYGVTKTFTIVVALDPAAQ